MTKLYVSGETPLPGAPPVTLDSGDRCIPQHYLAYAHTRQTVEQVIRDCQFDDDYLIMAGEDQQGLFIQIGIIGFDTYRPRHKQTKRKLVYGRRWRIEPHFPTSELIQTIFLAVRKAREHEVRERFKLTINGQQSAPFSTHQDLPLFIRQADALRHRQNGQALSQFRREAVALCRQLRFDHAALSILNIEQRYNGQLLVDIALRPTAHAELAETQITTDTLLLKSPSTNKLLFALMDLFIQRSNHQVAEHFTYQGIARFSQAFSAVNLANLSLQTRQRNTEAKHSEFYQRLAAHNECIDRNRAPLVVGRKLHADVEARLSRHCDIEGFMPASANDTQS